METLRYWTSVWKAWIERRQAISCFPRGCAKESLLGESVAGGVV